MKIEYFEIEGLMGRTGKVKCNLQPDLNIIAGKNGSGKTSILKLLWYIMSGNLLLALKEVNFKSCFIRTSEYECTVYRISRNTCKVSYKSQGREEFFDDFRDHDGDILTNAEDDANPVLMAHGSSLFLPTFRRIEGGFSTTNSSPRSPFHRSVPKTDIEEALDSLSRTLTNEPHVFVSSIATTDIVQLLLKEYANLSQSYTDLQQSTSQSVIEQIKAHKSDRKDVKKIEAANHVLDQVRRKIEDMEAQRERIMSPITAVQTLVKRIFSHSGIVISKNLKFGDAASAINSDLLSAGEKQMLSFICYNAFRKNNIIFIDEPELSLHPDWQRQLFPILLRQQASNQFILATHSPFIYSKYPDKEILIDADRGDAGGAE